MKGRFPALAFAITVGAGMALPAHAQQPGVAYPATPQADSGPPPLPALSSEQATNLNDEMTRYRQWVDARVARGEVTPEEAQRLVEWRRWQLARQIAGLAEPEPPRVVVQREYVARPYYDPWYRPYYYGPPVYYAPPVYYGPRLSVCAGGWGRHSFGSLCF